MTIGDVNIAYRHRPGLQGGLRSAEGPHGQRARLPSKERSRFEVLVHQWNAV
jgi:hypothetical protein